MFHFDCSFKNIQIMNSNPNCSSSKYAYTELRLQVKFHVLAQPPHGSFSMVVHEPEVVAPVLPLEHGCQEWSPGLS